MEIRQYLRILRRQWLLVGGVTLLVAGVVIVTSLLMTPRYSAQATVFVSTQGGASAADLNLGNNFAQQRVRSYADIALTLRVLAPAATQVGLMPEDDDLAGRVSAQIPPDTVLITLAATDENPAQAARIADAVAGSLVTTITELEAPEPGAPSPVRASIVEQAEIPTSPSSPNLVRNVSLGFLLGMLLGLGLAMLREILDTKVRTEADVRELTDATFLGGLPFDTGAPEHPLITHGDQAGIRAEPTRQLRTNLQFVEASSELKTLLVTSSIPGEGKSLTAANLAIVFAESGRKVCLVEADLRRPKATEYLGVEGAVGLTNVLIGEVTLDDVLQPWQDGGVTILAAGQRPPNPSELLGSQAMHDLLADLRTRFDVVLIDAPPLLPVTDAAVLAAACDGALLVVGSGRVDSQAVTKSLESLDKVNARVVGVVLNMASVSGSAGYYSYRYDSYSPQAKQKKGKGKGERSGTRAVVPAPREPAGRSR